MQLVMSDLDGRKRSDIPLDCEVGVVKKEHQRTGEITYGFVKRILTKSSFHPHGIKVMLDSGEVGRVKEIIE